MKRMFALLLSAILLVSLLPGCQSGTDETVPTPSAGPSIAVTAGVPAWTAEELANLALQYSGCDVEALETLSASADGERLGAYIENAYGLEDPWEDAAIIRATGASAFEIAVLRMADEKAAIRACTALMSYIFTRQGDFEGYAPAQSDMVAKGGIRQEEGWAALFICPDPDGADESFYKALTGTELPSPQLSPDPSPDPTDELITDVVDLRDYLLSIQGMEASALELLDGSDPEALSDYVEANYGLAREDWEEAAIAVGKGDSVFELAVFKVDSKIQHDYLDPVSNGLVDYLDAKEAQYSGPTYSTELLYQANAYKVGQFIILAVCPNSKDLAFHSTQAIGADHFSNRKRHDEGGAAGQPMPEPSDPPEMDEAYPGRYRFTPPNKEDMSLYDTTAIRAAWEQGDPSGLSDYDRDIYSAAQEALDGILTEGMSDYEKEAAIYDYLVESVDYDWTHQDIMATTPRESYGPYGGLVNHTAVCLGYATSFQLLMDLAGVECITVVGAAFRSEEHHAWNMVRLDGDWYCVDVTWDANQREQIGLGGLENWDYFNITSDDMAVNHQWDYANTPEATTEGGGQG